LTHEERNLVGAARRAARPGGDPGLPAADHHRPGQEAGADARTSVVEAWRSIKLRPPPGRPLPEISEQGLPLKLSWRGTN
jgi:hypothetical protein